MIDEEMIRQQIIERAEELRNSPESAETSAEKILAAAQEVLANENIYKSMEKLSKM